MLIPLRNPNVLWMRVLQWLNVMSLSAEFGVLLHKVESFGFVVFYPKLKNIGSNIGPEKEEYTHEFLRYVIDALQSLCIREAE
ncbi:hypothetical protein Tco_0102793 [Tanacetum coccineum]